MSRDAMRTGAWALVVAAAAVAVFAPTVSYGFVYFDDPTYVLDNARVADGLSAGNVRWAFSADYFSNWHPLTWLSYFLDAELFGRKPAGFHATNVLLHALNSVLCFVWFRSVTGSDTRSALVGLLFAVHPLHVEPVAWISSRKDLLAGLFFWLALTAYSAYARRGSLAWYGASLAAFVLSLASKQSVLPLPFLLLLVDVWPLRRMVPDAPTNRPAPGVPAEARAVSVSWRRLLCEKVPFGVAAVATVFVAYRAQQAGGAVLGLEAVPWAYRAGYALLAYEEYLFKAFWPVDLAAFYPRHAGRLGDFALLRAGAATGAVTAVVLIAARRRPYWLVGWFWFVGMLVPTIGLVTLGEQRIADRYMYLPIVGLFFGAVWTLPEAVGRWRRVAIAGCAAAVVGCAFASVRQCPAWRDSEALARNVHQANQNDLESLVGTLNGRNALFLAEPAKAVVFLEDLIASGSVPPVAHLELGSVLGSLGRCAEAVTHLSVVQDSVRMELPRLRLLATCLMDLGEYARCAAAAREALEHDPEVDSTRRLQGEALFLLGNLDAAAQVWEDAWRRNPDDLQALVRWRVSLRAAGRDAEAAQLEPLVPAELREIGARDVAAVESAGRDALLAGNVDEARARFVEALWMRPGEAALQVDLGQTYLRKGAESAAEFHFRRALDLAPRLVEARLSLAAVLLRRGDPEGAEEQLRRAAEDHPGDPRIAALRSQIPAAP